MSNDHPPKHLDTPKEGFSSSERPGDEPTGEDQTFAEQPAGPLEADTEPSMGEEEAFGSVDRDELRGAVEAILYAASEPLSLRDLKKILPEVSPEDVKECLEELLNLYSGEGRGLHIIEVAGGYQITTRPEFHERVSSLFKFKPPSRLTIQALETLATIAYRQPVTIPEIQELRGVRSSSVIRTLLDKRLIRIVGRKNVVGRPVLYGTTKEFLLRFGLKDLKELPSLEDMAEVFGEDVAHQLEELGGDPATVAGAPPAETASAGTITSEADVGKNGELPIDGGSDPSNRNGNG